MAVSPGLLWDRVGHAWVLYYSTIFALLGSIAVFILIPGGYRGYAANNNAV